MHPAEAFRERDAETLVSHLRGHPFATVAAAPAGRLMVAHAPMVVRRRPEGLALDFHLSRGNALAPSVAAGFPALVVSLGPEAYVSPDWYGNADQVPTWNYVSVEAQGPVTPLDESGLVALLDDLSSQEEVRLAPKAPWTRAKMSAGRFEGLLRGIVGARMTVQRLEGTFKLSQNKDEAERAGVVEALGDHPIALLMRRLAP